MNKEIKFRAWDDQWYYFVIKPTEENESYTISFGSSVYIELMKEGNLRNWGQFTRLKDKNGKEIYEGDIVRFRSMDNIPYRIGHIRILGGGLTANALETRIDTTDGYLYPLSNEREFPITQSEVIGNVCENPELLNK
jgi:hypothetical protein